MEVHPLHLISGQLPPHQTIPTGMVDKPTQISSVVHHSYRNGLEGWPGLATLPTGMVWKAGLY